MSFFSSLHQQVNRNFCLIITAYVPGFIFLVILGIQDYVPVGYLTRDPAEIMNTHPYIGMVSNLGVVMWTAATAICFLTGFLSPNKHSGSNLSVFFILSAALSFMLLLDDLFLIHECICPNRLHIHQQAVIIGYLCLLLVYLTWFRSIIRRTDFIFLATALFCFSLSAFSDAIGDFDPRYKSHIVEDGFKFLGILSWLVYYAVTSQRYLRKMLSAAT